MSIVMSTLHTAILRARQSGRERVTDSLSAINYSSRSLDNEIIDINLVAVLSAQLP